MKIIRHTKSYLIFLRNCVNNYDLIIVPSALVN